MGFSENGNNIWRKLNRVALVCFTTLLKNLFFVWGVGSLGVAAIVLGDFVPPQLVSHSPALTECFHERVESARHPAIMLLSGIAFIDCFLN